MTKYETQTSSRQKNPKKNHHIVTLYSAYTRVLTSEKFCQGLSAAVKKLRAAGGAGRGGAGAGAGAGALPRNSCFGSVVGGSARMQGGGGRGVGEGGVRVLDLCNGWSVTSLLALRAGAKKVLVMDPPTDGAKEFAAVIACNDYDEAVHVWQECAVSRTKSVGPKWGFI